MKILLSVIVSLLSSTILAQIPENINENNSLINSSNTLNEVEVKKNESLDSAQQFKTKNMVPSSITNRKGEMGDVMPKQSGYRSKSIQSISIWDELIQGS